MATLWSQRSSLFWGFDLVRSCGQCETLLELGLSKFTDRSALEILVAFLRSLRRELIQPLLHFCLHFLRVALRVCRLVSGVLELQRFHHVQILSFRPLLDRTPEARPLRGIHVVRQLDGLSCRSGE